jgi:signal transduction histidine kinase
MVEDFDADLAAVKRIEAVPTILDVVCRTTGMRFAAVARVTAERWIACGVQDEIDFGLKPGGELKVETTICHEIRQSGEAVIINHVAEDGAYRGHPTPAMYGFQSYISMPIVLSDGSFFGTLCAIDPRPAKLKKPETIGMFKLFAELIAFHLDANKRLAVSEASLLDERKTAELREQFIAVLGHDLRNPLSAISGSAELVSLQPSLDETVARSMRRIQRAAARMSGLIDDVLDFARGRLGGGLSLKRDDAEPLQPVLNEIVAELRASWPGREIDAQIVVNEPIDCDRGRIQQLFSNLLANALTHGAVDTPVRIRGSTGGGFFELSVANNGEPIPPMVLEYLFQPFFRGVVRESQQGLGLGLYIASEIARAHGGTIDAMSSVEETRFTFRMPLAKL